MFYSPLRYPGGKGKLAPFMKLLIEKTNHVGGTYIEPFAGGAGVALNLLENNIVSQIVINDLDKGIYSFWRAILKETDRFVDCLYNVPVDMEEWYRQRAIVQNPGNGYTFELGFATFYMNRTNRSGIIKGGVIGGLQQTGKWGIDARFNKENLINRILNIAERKKSIHLYNQDVYSLVTRFLQRYEDNAFIYFDPPYFEKGKELYMNFFDEADHIRIERMVREIDDCDWVITYDNVPEIADIYSEHNFRRFDLNYSAGKKRTASEIIVFSDNRMIPSQNELEQRKIKLVLR